MISCTAWIKNISKRFEYFETKSLGSHLPKDVWTNTNVKQSYTLKPYHKHVKMAF